MIVLNGGSSEDIPPRDVKPKFQPVNQQNSPIKSKTNHLRTVYTTTYYTYYDESKPFMAAPWSIHFAGVHWIPRYTS